MFRNHPKGLIVAFFTNMGERFGFYTMMAILVLFLQAKYGLSVEEAGSYYSWFYFAIYALALLGGILADSTKKYKTVILVGQVVMFGGYAMIALPGMTLVGSLVSLFVIALGNGLFKGNLQAVVGQLYDNPKYAKMRDSAFMLFYMGINVGAFFAPFVATGIRNWWLTYNGFLHDGSLPALCHQMIDGKIADTTHFQLFADKVAQHPVTDLNLFASQYLDVFTKGYNIAFGVAGLAMVVSLLVYLIFNKSLPTVSNASVSATSPSTLKLKNNMGAVALAFGLVLVVALLFHLADGFSDVKDINYKLGMAVGLFVGFLAMIFKLSTKEERPRIVALSLVFVVVIFFWMSFHQNGLTLTVFARDYTVKEVAPATFLLFNLDSILLVITTIAGLMMVFKKRKTSHRLLWGGVTIVAAVISWFVFKSYAPQNAISPEVFQAFNPLYIVALTPLVMGFFSYLVNKNSEPSTPRKIGIGMIIAAIGFVVVLLGSLNLVSPYLLGGAEVPDSSRVSVYWLMGTYLVLTVAELFLSPMGLSFVSKVAPKRFQGLMQGGWLLATAIGNKFLFVGSVLWGRIDLYLLWGIFIICCIVSALFVFAIMKRLEKVTQ